MLSSATYNCEQSTPVKGAYHSIYYNTDSGSHIFGTVSEEYNELGYCTSYFYDENNGRLLAVISPEGYGTCYSYDEIGNLTEALPAQMQYDEDYNPDGYIEDRDDSFVEYTYDSVTNRLNTITTSSTTYTFVYDTFGNTKEIKAGTNKLVSYDYNAGNGKLNTLTYGNGLKVKYVYDELDRISEICHNNNNGGYDTAYSYEYDSYGKLFSVTDHISDETTVFSYGANGKLTGSYVFETSTYNTLNSTGIYYNDDMKVSRVYRNVNYSGGWFMSYYSYKYNTDTGRISSMSVMDEELYGYFTPKYDGFGRLMQRTADFSRSDGPDDTIDMHYEKWTYSYSGGGFYGESSRVSKIVKEIRRSQSTSLLASTEYRLTYDGNGSITEIADSSGVVQNRYCYDDLGQLIREDNREMGRSYTYDYDDAGNRIQKKAFAFTLGALGSAVSVYQYSYASSGWRDRLTYDDYSYDSISYDAIGNPISIENDEDPDICTSLRWKGRLLMSFSDSEGPSVSFTYNADGIRTSKTVGGVKHKYTLDGSRIVSETWTKNNIEYFLYFIYDENGSPAGIEYRTSEYEDGEFDYYFFDKNIFGDIIGIYNESGRKICTYTYNAWGECTVSVASGLNGDDFFMAHEYNPFRYRGYYYDIETKYYYLQTRYYNPEWGRFLNADGYLNANGDILGYNMFAYCSNNPISFNDPTGEGRILDWLNEKKDDLANWFYDTFGAEATVSNSTDIEQPITPPLLPITFSQGTTITNVEKSYGDSSKPISVYANAEQSNLVLSSSAGVKINIGNFSLQSSLGLSDIGMSCSITDGDTKNSFGISADISKFRVVGTYSTSKNEITNYVRGGASGWFIVMVIYAIETGDVSQVLNPATN